MRLNGCFRMDFVKIKEVKFKMVLCQFFTFFVINFCLFDVHVYLKKNV